MPFEVPRELTSYEMFFFFQFFFSVSKSAIPASIHPYETPALRIFLTLFLSIAFLSSIKHLWQS